MVEVLTIEPNGTKGQLSLEGEPTRERETNTNDVGAVLVGRESGCSQSVYVNSSPGNSTIRRHKERQTEFCFCIDSLSTRLFGNCSWY